MGILLDMGWEMQEEWDLSGKAASLDYNKTMLTSTGQAPNLHYVWMDSYTSCLLDTSCT